MTNTAAASPRLVIVDRVIPRSIATDVVLVVVGAALTAALAQVVIPMWPVPITGQTLAALLVGASLGSIRGASSIALYAVVGLLGAPISAPTADGGHLTGLAWLAAPSFGYVIGMVLAAALVGWLAQLKWDRRIWQAVVAFLAGSVVIYAVGLPWLAAVTQGTPEQVIAWGLTPFLIGDVVKALIAGALLPAAWWAVRRVRGQ
ncbi:MAG TPA: biotin transporter BioY [Microbacteriaceae bacterium]|nr:biotin transporter BioY [Microbacteriaceae bacterium]